MSKSLPVYDISQWIKSDRNIGYVVARMSAANIWEVRDDYANRKDVERFNGRGAGYVIQWVEPRYADDATWFGDPPSPIGVDPYRLSWLRAETIAEKRYQPCENPVKASAVAEQDDEGEEVIEFDRNRDGVVTFGAPSQPVLPLDIEPRWCGGAEQVVEVMGKTEDVAIDIMRAVSVAGKMADDWLRAKGLTL